MREYQANRLLDEKFLLGEGPFFDDENGRLTWVDIKTGTLHGLESDGRRFQIQTGQYLGAAIPVEGQDRYVGMMTTGLYWIEKEKIQKLYSLEGKFLDFQRANDAKCDPCGRLWFESMPLFSSTMKQGGNVYCFSEKEGCNTKITHTIVANGMAWSIDTEKFYFIDSGTGCVYGYDYENTTGNIKNGRKLCSFQEGTPDGMTIDKEGMLWIAFWGSGFVGRVNPENGEITARIEVPARNVSSCCFGGKDHDILYITSSSEGMTGEQEGCVFMCKVDVPGEKNVKFKY